MSKKIPKQKNAPLISLSVTSIKNFIDIIFLHGTKVFQNMNPLVLKSRNNKVHKIENKFELNNHAIIILR